MLNIHVTRLLSGDSRTAEISMARGASIYLCLMQARSQGLEFDLETSRFYLNNSEVAREAIETTRVTENSIIIIRPKPPEQTTIVELD